MELKFDAVIIGAGPAGSGAAILLAKKGWRIALIEKQRFPRPKVCGECIAASNFPLLEEMGIGDAVSQLAGPHLKRLNLLYGTHAISAPLPRSDNAKYFWGRALDREHLDGLLLERAKQNGAEIFQPWAIKSIAGEPGDFICHAHEVRSNTHLKISTPLVIAAHGCWQPAPGEHKSPPHPSDLLAFKATFEKGNLPRETLTILSFPGGYGGIVMSGSERLTLAFCIRRDVLSACRLENPELSAAEAAQKYVITFCPAVKVAINNATFCGKWLTIGPLQPGIRIPRQGDKIFLVGNAAGEAHPIIGEGISMALQSAWLLANQISKYERITDANYIKIQKQYAAAWHHHFSTRIRLASFFANLSMQPRFAQYAFPLIRHCPALLTYAAKLSGKIRSLWLPDMDKSTTNSISKSRFLSTRSNQGGS